MLLLRKAKHHKSSQFCTKYNSDTWNLKYNLCCLRGLHHREGQTTRQRRPNVTGRDVMTVIMAKTRRTCSNRKRIEKLSVTMATHSRCNIFVPSRPCHRKYRDTSRLSQTSGNYSAANINGQAYQTYLLPPSVCSRADWYKCLGGTYIPHLQNIICCQVAWQKGTIVSAESATSIFRAGTHVSNYIMSLNTSAQVSSGVHN
jgi:hypothetical protein